MILTLTLLGSAACLAGGIYLGVTEDGNALGAFGLFTALMSLFPLAGSLLLLGGGASF